MKKTDDEFPFEGQRDDYIAALQRELHGLETRMAYQLEIGNDGMIADAKNSIASVNAELKRLGASAKSTVENLGAAQTKG